MEEFWTYKDSLNLFIGLLGSLLTAWSYEYLSNKRRKIVFKKKYIFLESEKNVFDWQHWDIERNQIAETPIKSFMTLKYEGEKEFSFRWKKEISSKKEEGDGSIFWDDLTHGKLSYFEYDSLLYNYRNVFYKELIIKIRPMMRYTLIVMKIIQDI